MPGRHLRPTLKAERDWIISLRNEGVPIQQIAARVRRSGYRVSAVLVEAGLHERKRLGQRGEYRPRHQAAVRERRPAPHRDVLESSFIKSPTLEQLMSGRGLIPR